VTDDPPERPGLAALAERLRVRRNAAVGLAVGVALAAAVYAVRVFELLGPFRGTQSFPVVGAAGWFLLLAVVLAVSTAAVVAAVLTLVTAYRVVRATAAEEPEAGR
jgi:uncharacterized membrane protein